MAQISDFLARYPDEPKLADEIYKAFISLARGVAENRISEKLQARVSASEVANSAMRSALSHAKNGRLDEPTSDDFRNLLVRIVINKVCDAARRHERGMRDAGRDQQTATPVPGKNLTPDIKASLNEISAHAAVELLTARGGTDVNLRTYIAVLGTFHDCSASSIKAALEEHFPDEPRLALRTIQAQIKADRDLLLELLRSFGSSNDE